jgi:hypothetical protein
MSRTGASVIVRVADWSVALSSPDDRLLARLAERYRGFLDASESQPDVVCLVTVRAPAGDVTASTVPVAPTGTVLVDRPDVRARWPEDSHQVDVSVTAASALAGVELVLRIVCARLAFQAGGLLLHGAGILRNQGVHLFIGPSGAGKTTVARLSKAATVLNDDLVVVRPALPRWTVRGTPFSNPSQVSPTHATGPLVAVWTLQQSAENNIVSQSTGRALAHLLAAVPVMTGATETLPPVVERLKRLLETVTYAELAFNLDGRFWSNIDEWMA